MGRERRSVASLDLKITGPCFACEHEIHDLLSVGRGRGRDEEIRHHLTDGFLRSPAVHALSMRVEERDRAIKRGHDDHLARSVDNLPEVFGLKFDGVQPVASVVMVADVSLGRCRRV